MKKVIDLHIIVWREIHKGGIVTLLYNNYKNPQYKKKTKENFTFIIISFKLKHIAHSNHELCVIYCAILDIYTHKPTRGNSNVDMVISDDNDVVISDDDFDKNPLWSEENQRSVEFHFHLHNTIHAIMMGFLCVPFCISKCGDIRAAAMVI